MTDPNKASEPTVAARDLDIGYHDEPVVQNINFSLEKGQSLALVGVNG